MQLRDQDSQESDTRIRIQESDTSKTILIALLARL